MGTRGRTLDRELRLNAILVAALLLASVFVGTVLLPVVSANQGPADSCGYQWTDSTSPPPTVDFNWTDIQPTGTRIENNVWTGWDDGYAGPYPLGFNFTFYGTTFFEVFVSTNGYVSFGDGSADIPSEPIPSENTPNNFAMAFGDDLVPGYTTAPDGVYVETLTSPNRFVVEWLSVPHYGGNQTFDPVTFEILLYETGEIWFQYLTVQGGLTVVGIESGDGSIGTGYDPVDVTNALAVRFATPPPAPGAAAVALSPCSQPRKGIAGTSVDTDLTVSNLGAGGDTFDLTFSSPSGWAAAFYSADGTTPLNDTNSNGEPDTGPLSPDGSLGITLRVDIPSNGSGYERITVNATSSLDSNVIGSARVNVRVVQAFLTPPHYDFAIDADGDGQFDELIVAVNVTVGVAATYELGGHLHNPSYNLSVYDYNYSYLDVGVHTIWLNYLGFAINGSEVDGPYRVFLTLVDTTIWTMWDSATILTAAYSHLDFEATPARFSPPHFDYGSDWDQDGQYNYLVLDVNLTVDVAATYYVDGILHDPTFALSLDAWFYGYLDVGFRTLEFNYDGSRINASGVDGPYLVSLRIFHVADVWSLVDSEIYTTAAYTHLDFEPPEALLSPPHDDTGFDVDGDGQFDFLNLDVTVQVNVGGTYQVFGYLHDPTYTLYLYAVSTLYYDPGLRTFTLSYSGVAINQSGIDGPYTVDLYLYNYYGGFLDNEFYTTAAYSHSDFDGDYPPVGAFAPPHADEGIDGDGDGLYNYLAVDVRIAVGQSIPLYLVGALHDSTNAFNLTASLWFYPTVGLQTVQLRFDGVPINASGVDGPYIVNLWLYNGYTGELLDTGTHTTAAYSHEAFNGPPGRFLSPHEDFGRDDDGDGLFNRLIVEANVTTTYAGIFFAYAYLWFSVGGPNGTGSSLVDTNLTYLSGGAATITFEFNGYRINASGIDGPYRVDMWMYDGTTYQFLDNDTYWTTAYAHADFEEIPRIDSPYAATRPAIDGLFSPGEWVDALVEPLSGTAGNSIPAYMLVADDNQFLYVAYDVVGDTTPDSYDAASIGFDTGNDGIATDGTEDELVIGAWWGSQAAHYVFGGGNGSWSYWNLHDSPINESLPNHAGLAAARGFGRSGFNSSFHRVYEFRIPFALLGVRPGDTIGFVGGSHELPGIYDASIGRSDQWPDNSGGGPLPLEAYGDLALGPDVTKPEIAIDSPAPGTLFPTEAAMVSWSASDIGLGLDHFLVSVDGTVVAILPATSTSYTFTGLADGTRTLAVTAVDGAGNDRSAFVDVRVDTTPPTVAMSSPVPGSYLAVGEVTATWSATDAISGIGHFEVTLDGTFRVNLPATASTFTYPGIADGVHTIAVTAVDVAGHSSTASAPVTIDTIVPNVTPLSPSAHALLKGPSATVTWTAGDSGSGLDRIEISLDGDPSIVLPGAATSHTFETLSDGPHVVVISAVDRAGNRDSVSLSFTVDATPPTLAITSPVDQAILPISAISVSWSSADTPAGLDRFEVTLDGGVPTVLGPGSSTYALLGVADGTHIVTVRSVDRAGNERSASVVVVVDTVPPTLTITSPMADGLVSTSSVGVAWASQDVTSGIDHFTVSLDGATAVDTPGSATEYTFAGVPDGVRSVRVTAIDRAGHSRTAFVTFVVDRTPPTLTLISPTDGAALTSSSVELRFTAVDATGGVTRIEIVVDGAAPFLLGGDASSYTIAGLTDGSHTIMIRAVDRAGNVQQSSITVHVDTAVLSPSGPYGVAPLGGLSIAVFVAVLGAILVMQRRRRVPPEQPPEGNA